MMSSSAFLSKPSVTNNLHGNSWHCDSSSWLNTMINSHHSSWLFCSIQHRCFLLSSNITFILVWDTTCYRLFIFHWPPLSLAFVLTHSLPRLLPSHHCECWAVVLWPRSQSFLASSSWSSQGDLMQFCGCKTNQMTVTILKFISALLTLSLQI